jgi:TolB-like protein/Tfp pilus assembly protein PilF
MNNNLINQQVLKILASPSFVSSVILTDFLLYIVAETLNGNEEGLKEYVIATNVLNRKADFNPQLDAIVRIHAHRLRNHLKDYYTNIGAHDAIVISIPKGRYIPVFENNNSFESANTSSLQVNSGIKESKPKIAVLPLNMAQDNKRLEVICSVFCQDLIVAFSRFQEIAVLSNYAVQYASDNFKNQREIVSHLNVDFALTGSCFLENNNLVFFLELNAVSKDEIIWAETFIIEDYLNNDLSGYRTIIRKVIASTCGFFGFIYRNTINNHVPNDFDHLYAIYWHNYYHTQFSEEAYLETMKAIEIGLAKNPSNSLLIAFKAELLLNLLALDIQGEADYLKMGLQLVKKAIILDPLNQHAYQVLAWANLLSHNKKESLRSMEKCISINPNNAMYSGSVGFGYVCAGEYKRGLDLMAEAIMLNPYYHWDVNVGFCLYYIYQKEYSEAYFWAEKIDRKKLLWDPLFRATILGYLNKQDEAKEAVQELMILSPQFPQRGHAIISTFLLDNELRKSIAEGLELAGIQLVNK